MPAEGTLRDRDAAGFELIETLRWEPGTGFQRGDRHLARLRSSAAALGFAFDEEAATETLERVVSGHQTPLRVRLVLQSQGKVAVSAQPYQALPTGTAWKVAVATTRLDSADPLLRHKISRRAAYERARLEYSAEEANEVLLLNERGELCEGTITNLFADFGDGVLTTPAADCGLLPGVLRAELLRSGRAREAVLTPDRVTQAANLFVGNSLRGLIPARLLTRATAALTSETS